MSSRGKRIDEVPFSSVSAANGAGVLPVRILMPVPQGVRGPMPRLGELLAEALRAQGFEVLPAAWGGDDRSSLPARLLDRARDVAAIRRSAKAQRPDVLLVQTSLDWKCILRDLALARSVRGRGRIVVLQFHGSRTDLLERRRPTFFKRGTRLLLRHVDAVFVLSSEERRILERFHPGGRYYLVANPFVALPEPAEDALPVLDVPVVLFASRLLREKGILDTIEAFAMLRDRVPAHLLVAGEGSAAADAEHLVRERGLDRHVTFVGRLPPDRLQAAYRRADVFVLPTYATEGFPTAVTEAMSAGLPVVTSKVRGNADHLVDGTNALFVPPREPRAIAAALELLLTDPALRKRMSAANRRKVKEFAPERVARAYVAALADLLSLTAAARHAFELGSRREWKSHDPYDLLLSPAARGLQARSWLGARVIVQVGKRSGTRLRRAMRVPQHEEPKALAEFLRAAAMLSTEGEEWAQAYVDELSVRLQAHATAQIGGYGWGLEFPYASRFVNAERGAANVYVTTVACQALLDHHDLTGDEAALATALAGCRFILDGLGTFEHRGRRWLRYWHGLDTPAVNVQASAASLLARAGFAGDADLAAEAALSAQRDDGSWPYSDDGRASFVDGFHTGFTLQGLTEYATSRGAEAATGVDEAVERGFSFFKAHLLTSDGLPRGVADGKVKLEGQNVAQCVQTLAVCGRAPDDRDAAMRLWRLGVEPLLRGRGSRFPALRWDIGPAVLATSYLLRSTRTAAYASTMRSSV
jgi:glycosyltransferase involved in cell wall biosynthesis